MNFSIEAGILLRGNGQHTINPSPYHQNRLWDYTGGKSLKLKAEFAAEKDFHRRKPTDIYYFLHTNNTSYIFCTQRYDSLIIYERKFQSNVFYVIPVISMSGRLPVAHVGETGTIPYSMHSEAADFPGASCDSKKNTSDGCIWWYINTWALKGAISQSQCQRHIKYQPADI